MSFSVVLFGTFKSGVCMLSSQSVKLEIEGKTLYECSSHFCLSPDNVYRWDHTQDNATQSANPYQHVHMNDIALWGVLHRQQLSQKVGGHLFRK